MNTVTIPTAQMRGTVTIPLSAISSETLRKISSELSENGGGQPAGGEIENELQRRIKATTILVWRTDEQDFFVSQFFGFLQLRDALACAAMEEYGRDENDFTGCDVAALIHLNNGELVD